MARRLPQRLPRTGDDCPACGGELPNHLAGCAGDFAEPVATRPQPRRVEPVLVVTAESLASAGALTARLQREGMSAGGPYRPRSRRSGSRGSTRRASTRCGRGSKPRASGARSSRDRRARTSVLFRQRTDVRPLQRIVPMPTVEESKVNARNASAALDVARRSPHRSAGATRHGPRGFRLRRAPCLYMPTRGLASDPAHASTIKERAAAPARLARRRRGRRGRAFRPRRRDLARRRVGRGRAERRERGRASRRARAPHRGGCEAPRRGDAVGSAGP